MDILNRFREPSSWAGIAVLLNVFAPVIGIPVGGIDLIVQAGSALAAAAAFFIAEKR